MGKKRFHHKPHRPVDTYEPQGPEKILSKPISELKLTSYTMEALTNGSVLTVRDIMKRTEQDMYKIQKFGKRNLEDVKRALATLGVALKPSEPRNDTHTTTGAPNNVAKSPAPKPVRNKPTTPGEPEEWTKYKQNNKWGFRDLLNKVRIPAEYDEIFLFHEGFACFEKVGNFGYIDSTNNVVIEAKYECAMSFSEGLACVTIDNKCGYINKSGETVIPFLYDAGTQFHDGMAKVKADGKWGKITSSGEVISWDK